MEPIKRGPWTLAEIDAVRCWHDSRLIECGYSPSVVRELTQAREKFIAGIPIKRI